MAIPFSDGVENIVRDIHPYGLNQGGKWFPKRWDPVAVKQGGSESLHAWYRRCVDTCFDGRPSRYAIEENFMAFVSVRWVDNQKLTFVSAQAIIVQNKSLDSYYANDSDQVQYLRLDYNGARIGAMFKEHWPHVHIAEDGEPRFPSDYTTTGNIVIDFFDFIYRNYYHDKWLNWAQAVWAPRAVKLGMVADPFPVVAAAFNAHKIDALLSTYKDYVVMMKQAWRENNDKLLPLFVNNHSCRLLSYTG